MADPKPLPEGSLNVAEVAAAEVAKLDALRAWAEQPEHFWRQGKGAAGRPGSSHDRVRALLVKERGEMRVYTIVFTITETNLGLMRHASVAVNAGAYEPLVPVTWMLLQRLGFHGRPETWLWQKSEGRLPRVYEILEPFVVQ